MRGPIELEFVSTLDADVRDVWRVVSTMQGVNFELHPLVHMTSGRHHTALPAAIEPGRVIFRSWLLLFHVLPFDRHSLALDLIEAGQGFVEESSSWLQRRWRHERRLAPERGHGCSITDRLVIEPRLRCSQPLVALIVEKLFLHRHRQLVQRFGATARPH